MKELKTHKRFIFFFFVHLTTDMSYIDVEMKGTQSHMRACKMHTREMSARLHRDNGSRKLTKNKYKKRHALLILQIQLVKRSFFVFRRQIIQHEKKILFKNDLNVLKHLFEKPRCFAHLCVEIPLFCEQDINYPILNPRAAATFGSSLNIVFFTLSS